MSDRDLPEKPDPSTPPRCPVCHSAEVSTMNKAASHDAYWRCGSCGHVWNPARVVKHRRNFL